MAIALEKLEDQLNCSICLDTYTNPKVLLCNHVYCQQCLVKLVIRDQHGQLILACPNCRQVTPVPANGVAGLQTAFRVNQLLEIVEEQKKAEAAPENAEIPRTDSTVGCPEHGGREVELYCNTCEKTICLKCVIKNGKHHSHNYEELSEAFERYQQEITSSLEPLEKQLETIKKALQQFDVRHDEISNQQATIEADIHSTIARLHETLDVRKTELIDQLHQLTQAKLKSLAAQRDQIETAQAQLTSCLLFMRENLKKNLKTGNQGEALLISSTTVRQIRELTTTFPADILEPNTEADMIFSTLKYFTFECQNYGLVVTHAVDPSKCYATGKKLDTGVAGEKSNALLQIQNFKNEPSCKQSDNSVTCELVSEIRGTKVRGSVERRGQSQYKISYQPTIKGRHQLHIKVEGQHIRGSPFPVTVTSSIEKLGIPLATFRKVKGPMGVAINWRGEVVVTEASKGGRCVTVFSPSGKRLRSFGKFSSGGGGFLNPAAVAVDGKGNIFVADQIDHYVLKFSSEGDLLEKVRIESGNTKLYPHGVAFSTTTAKLYVTVDDHVQILHSDLRPAGEFGKKGRKDGEFNYLRHVSCDRSGNVYVVDCWNQRIQVFTAGGKFLRKFGCMMQEPHGIAVDSSGSIYVSDHSTGCVSIFTSSGQLTSGLDIFDKKDCLRGLAVDSSGVLYICDQGTGTVRLF